MAAALHGLYRHSGVIDVTAPKPRTVDGIRRHRARGGLHPDDHTIIDGIPVTTLPRLCLDISETLAPRYLDTILENIQRQDKFDLHSFDAVLARNPGRHGLRTTAAET